MSDAIVTRWTEWVVEDGKWRSEMVVETSVETGTDAPGYDPTALEELVAVALDLRGAARPDRIRIVPKARASFRTHNQAPRRRQAAASS